MTVKKQSDDDIAFDDLLTESKEICVFQLTLNITLEQLDGAIGLQVRVLTHFMGQCSANDDDTVLLPCFAPLFSAKSLMYH